MAVKVAWLHSWKESEDSDIIPYKCLIPKHGKGTTYKVIIHLCNNFIQQVMLQWLLTEANALHSGHMHYSPNEKQKLYSYMYTHILQYLLPQYLFEHATSFHVLTYKLTFMTYLKAPSELSTRSANHGIDWDAPWRWMMSRRKSGCRLRHSRWPIRCVEFSDWSCSKTACGGLRGGPVGSIVINYNRQTIIRHLQLQLPATALRFSDLMENGQKKSHIQVWKALMAFQFNVTNLYHIPQLPNSLTVYLMTTTTNKIYKPAQLSR